MPPRVNVNMNQTYREVVGRFVGAPQELSHKQTVTRLYRQSLKTLDSWIIDRRLWNEEATKIRAEFDQNRALATDSGCVRMALAYEGKDGKGLIWNMIVPVVCLVVYGQPREAPRAGSAGEDRALHAPGQVRPEPHAWRLPLHAQRANPARCTYVCA